MIHFGEELDAMRQHWKENGIAFDAILVGYLGSIPAIKLTERVLQDLLAPDGVAIVDPAMADHGKLYSGFDPEYARAMERLCRQADIILPNVTEAAMFAGMEYRENLEEGYVRELLQKHSDPLSSNTVPTCRNSLPC